MKVLILGTTGLVGQSTLVQAVTHPAITQVIAPTRNPLPPNSKLANPVAERLEFLLAEVLTWGVDAVIFALGTTSGKAGSKEAFRQVDYVLPLAFAKLAHQQGAEILTAFPRLAFKDEFKGCNVVRQKPMTAVDNILRDFGIRYVEGFAPPNFADLAAGAPFSE